MRKQENDERMRADGFLYVDDAAVALRCSASTLRRAYRKGCLVGQATGRLYLKVDSLVDYYGRESAEVHARVVEWLGAVPRELGGGIDVVVWWCPIVAPAVRGRRVR